MLKRYRERYPGAPLGHLLLFELCRAISRCVLVLLYRVKSSGRSNIAQTGPLLIVANHQSFLDPPLVGSFLGGRHTDFIARGGLFSSPSFGWLISRLNSIPVGEGRGEAAAIKEALRRLKGGHAVILFPEGSRSPDGAMREFKRGIALLVKKARCPVVPAALEGAHDAWPRGRSLPFVFGKRVALCYGEPIPHAELMRDGPDAALRRLEAEIDAMRLGLRAELRAASGGSYPLPGPGDVPHIPGESGDASDRGDTGRGERGPEADAADPTLSP